MVEVETNENVSKSDAINHPSHYSEGRKYEPIEVICDWGLNFDLGNTVKYVSRAGRKANNSAVQDLKKAKFYLEHAIKKLEEDEGN